MTTAVLYTTDLQPITVIDLKPWAWERLARGERINLVVIEKLTFHDITAPQPQQCSHTGRRVTIFGDRMRRGKHETLMLFTDDEESALLLQAEFLPGQRREAQERERGAFAKGFLHALDML